MSWTRDRLRRSWPLTVLRDSLRVPGWPCRGVRAVEAGVMKAQVVPDTPKRKQEPVVEVGVLVQVAPTNPPGEVAEARLW